MSNVGWPVMVLSLLIDTCIVGRTPLSVPLFSPSFVPFHNCLGQVASYDRLASIAPSIASLVTLE